MIYLANDTDVWLRLIGHGITTENNYLDELIFWLESGRLRCILPQHVITEFERHKAGKVKELLDEYRKPTLLNRDIHTDTRVVSRISDEAGDQFRALAQARVGKIENIFQRYADIVAVTEEIMLEAGERTLTRKAPSHKRDSYGDCVNILCVLDARKKDSVHAGLFASLNTKDYSEREGSFTLHPDLAPLFAETALEYVCNIDYLFGKSLRPVLPDFAQHLAGLKQSTKKADAPVVLTVPDEDFIANTESLKHFLLQPRPTAYQLKSVKELIDSDEACRIFFFQQIETPVWFPFLKDNGYLDPAGHPMPVSTPDGVYLAHWLPLPYLQKISLKIKDGEFTEMIQPLLDIIVAVSQSGLDNDLTFSALIIVLGNLPNERISLETLSHIPAWFSGTSNRMLPTSAACKALLPKFLSPQASQEDIQKAEFILGHMLGISTRGVEIDNTPEKLDSSFYANAYPYFLSTQLVDEGLIRRVAEYCSDNLFYDFARTLKRLLLDHPSGSFLRIGEGASQQVVRFDVRIPDLLLTYILPGESEQTRLLKDFEQLNDTSLKAAIKEEVQQLGLAVPDNSEGRDFLTGIVHRLTVDRLSEPWASSIADMDLRHSHSKQFRVTYGILLREYLDAITDANPERAAAISLELFCDHRFRLPFFRRVVLQNIDHHFESQRVLFLHLISPNDPHGIFDNYFYRPELFNLLQHNQKHLNAAEIDVLNGIIGAGPKNDADDQKKGYWQFRWYLALNQVSPFSERYQEVKQAYDLTDRDGTPNQALHFRSGSVPPLAVAQVLEMTNKQIVSYLRKFNPQDRWEEPNVSGMANVLENAVKAQPGKFIKGLSNYAAIPYIYAYHLLYGLLESGRKKPEEFDWEAVLQYCRQYLQSRSYTAKTRMLKTDSSHADHNWVNGVIAFIISDTTRQDNYVKEKNLLPVCRELVLLLYRYFRWPEFDGPQNGDYLSHSLNSDSGKFLRACLDYSLCNARITDVEKPFWDPVFKEIFEQALLDKVADVFILIGFYWPQFNYLDHAWLEEKIQGFASLQEKEWHCFIGGFLFSSPPSTEYYLQLFAPHYERAISERVHLKNSIHNGSANHLVALFFWNLLGTDKESLMVQYIRQMPHQAVQELFHAIWFNEEYFQTLNDQELKEIEKRVLPLIHIVNEIYSQSEDVEIIELRCSMTHILYLVRELDEETTDLVVEAIKLSSKQYHTNELLDQLTRLTSAGEPERSAIFLGSIMTEMVIPDGMWGEDQQQWTTLIQFLYDHDQREIANKLCNRLSQKNHAFARELFLKNNPG